MPCLGMVTVSLAACLRRSGSEAGGGLILDERNGVSYPDGFHVPNGTLCVSHDPERARLRKALLPPLDQGGHPRGPPRQPEFKA